MKKLKLFFSVLSALIICFAVYGCGSEPYSHGAIGGVEKPEYYAYDGAERDVDYYAEEPSGEDDKQLGAGQITAAAHNDNEHYEDFLALFKAPENDLRFGGNSADDETSGKFYNYFYSDRWGFNANERVIVRVRSGEDAVAGATVRYFNADQRELSAVTDSNGVAYIFPDTESGTVTVSSASYGAQGEFDKDDRDITISLDGQKSRDNLIKLMFVVDVTGSMGDELVYLKTELSDVIHRVAAANEGVEIDLALMFYRDHGDSEIFRYYDFLRVSEDSGLNEAVGRVGTQYASGGGDYPEAMDEALEKAVESDWGEENSTKIIFHLYDAPPHKAKQNKLCYERAVRLAAEKGIRINPVLCSGADDLCEYLAREAAIHTAGHFVYVTDDSGIGESHYDPMIENAVVEKLNELMIRLINGYHGGTFAAPVPVRPPKTETKKLDLDILQDVSDFDWTGFTEVLGWFGAREFYGKGYAPTINVGGTYTDPDECVKYLVTAWPDYSDGGSFVTKITVTDPNVVFLGLTIDSSVEEFDGVLIDGKGFVRDDQTEFDEMIWRGNDFFVSLREVNGKRVVKIEAPVSNENNIVY